MTINVLLTVISSDEFSVLWHETEGLNFFIIFFYFYFLSIDNIFHEKLNEIIKTVLAKKQISLAKCC